MSANTSNAEQITVVANAIGVAIARQLNADEQNILGNLLTLVAGTILSIAAMNQAGDQQDGGSVCSPGAK